MADFDGDGSPELAMVLANGEGWRLAFETAGEQPQCVRAALPLKGPYAGPLTVTGWRGDRCLGAWNVVAGTGEAFVALAKPGPVTLKWQFPGAKPQRREVNLTGPSRLVLEAEGGPPWPRASRGTQPSS